MSDEKPTVFAITRDQIADALTGRDLDFLDGPDHTLTSVVADPGKVADAILADAATPTAGDFDRAAEEISAVDMLGVAVNALEEIAAAPDLRIAQITAAGALDIIRNRFTGDGEWKLISRAQPGQPRRRAMTPDVKISLGELFHSRWRESLSVQGAPSLRGRPWAELTPSERQAAEDGVQAVAEAVRLAYPRDIEPDGQWLLISFMGHVELTGWVTEITLGAQPAFHVDLPDKLWGANPMAWEEYAGSALYSRRPVTEESVRQAWEAQRERAAQRAREEAEWHTRQQQRALEAANDDDESQGEAF